jgi:hypothetical protein
MKVFFSSDNPQEHPYFGLLQPGENDIPESEELTDAIERGFFKASKEDLTTKILRSGSHPEGRFLRASPGRAKKRGRE